MCVSDTSEPYQIGIKATHYNRMSYSFMLYYIYVVILVVTYVEANMKMNSVLVMIALKIGKHELRV